MYNDNEHGLEAGDREGMPFADPGNLEKYKEELSDLELTDEQADELLRTLYDIIRMFVEMGFSGDLCGQLLDGFNQLSSGDTADVDSSSAKEDQE